MEVDLLKAYRAGKREALTRIYREHARAVHRYLCQRLGAGEEVADVVQEVFIRAFSEAARTKYDGAREYGPFLRVIARNVFVDRARRWRREIAVDGEQLEAAIGNAVNEYAFDPFLAEDTSDLEAVIEYVSTLAPELRRVYEERFVRASTQQQAAAALGISRQALRTRERKLLAGLRQRLRRATSGRD